MGARGKLEITVIGLGLVLAAVGMGVLSAPARYQIEGAIRSGAYGAVIVGAVLLLVGLISFVVVAPIRNEPRAKQFGSHRAVIATTGLALLLSGLLPVALFRNRPDLGGQSLDGFLVAALSTAVSLLVLAYVRTQIPGLATWRELGLRWEGLPSLVRRGLIGGLLLFGANIAYGLLMQQLGIVQDQMDAFIWVRALGPSQFLVVLALGAIVAPVVEEVFFRGFVFGSYARRYGPRLGAILSSTLFALLHANLSVLVPILLMGLVLAWLYYRSGSLVPGIVAHGINNAIAFSLFYLIEI